MKKERTREGRGGGGGGCGGGRRGRREQEGGRVGRVVQRLFLVGFAGLMWVNVSEMHAYIYTLMNINIYIYTHMGTCLGPRLVRAGEEERPALVRQLAVDVGVCVYERVSQPNLCN